MVYGNYGKGSGAGYFFTKRYSYRGKKNFGYLYSELSSTRISNRHRLIFLKIKPKFLK